MKFILALIMLTIGIILMLLLDKFDAGTVWLVGALLLSWMPNERRN